MRRLCKSWPGLPEDALDGGPGYAGELRYAAHADAACVGLADAPIPLVIHLIAVVAPVFEQCDRCFDCKFFHVSYDTVLTHAGQACSVWVMTENTGSHRRSAERREDTDMQHLARIVGNRPTCPRCGGILRQAPRDGSLWCESHGQQG